MLAIALSAIWLLAAIVFRDSQFFDVFAVLASAVTLFGAIASLQWRPSPRWRSFRLISLVVFAQAFLFSGLHVVGQVDLGRLQSAPAPDAFSEAVILMATFAVVLVFGMAVPLVFVQRHDTSNQPGSVAPAMAIALALCCAVVSGVSSFIRVLPGGVMIWLTLFNVSLILPLLAASTCVTGESHRTPYAIIGTTVAALTALTSMLGAAFLPALTIVGVYMHRLKPLPRNMVIAAAIGGSVMIVLQPAKFAFRTERMKETSGLTNAYAPTEMAAAADLWVTSILDLFDPEAPNQPGFIDAARARMDYNAELATVLTFVPRLAPFEGGATYADTLEIITPRLLDPEKDSTGLSRKKRLIKIGLQTWEQTSQVSIDLPLAAEAYWNWGWPGVVFVGLFVGMAIGGLLLIAPTTAIGESAYVVLLATTMGGLLGMMPTFVVGLFTVVVAAGLLRVYVRATDTARSRGAPARAR